MTHRSKIFITACLTLILAASVLGSCVKDPDLVCPPEQGVSGDGTTTFTISVPNATPPSATRSIVKGSERDNMVNDVMVLLFEDTADGSGKFVSYANGTNITDNDSDSKIKTFQVIMPDEAYDVLILANTASLLGLGAEIDGDLDFYQNQTIEYFEKGASALVLDALGNPDPKKWNTSTTTEFKPFPMSGHFQLPDAANRSSMGQIQLTRMLAKINVTMSMSKGYTAPVDAAAQYRLVSVTLANFNRRGTVVQPVQTTAHSFFDASRLNLPATVNAETGVSRVLKYTPDEDEITDTAKDSFGNTIYECVDEIFLPETAAPANADDPTLTAWKGATCLLLEVYVPSLGTNRWFRVDFQLKDGNGVLKHANIIRNFRYGIDIQNITGNGFSTPQEAYDALPEGMVTTIEAIDESDMNDITFDGRNQLTVNKDTFVFSADGYLEEELKVFTDYTQGWKIAEPTGDFTVTPAPAVGSANATTSVKLTAPAYMGNTVREGSFVITAGALRKTIRVFQLPETTNITDIPATPVWNFVPYVGAFWKANQTGERLIRIERPSVTPEEVDGKWMAIVVEGRDWIQLDTLMTTDPNVGWLGGNEAAVDNGNDAGFDSRHQVVGDNEMVDGMLDAEHPQIYFRIGLNGHHPASENIPARYGLVLMLYNDGQKQQRIWIRQGEEADYLMRPTDVIAAGPLAGQTRTAAAKFSPYNLTAETLDAVVDATFATSTTGNTTEFVNYPTKAGALFQWLVKNRIVAFNAHINSTETSGYWSARNDPAVWGDNYLWSETCPIGYHRPSNGPIDMIAEEFVGVLGGPLEVLTPAQLALSEMQLSLMLAPQLGIYTEQKLIEQGNYNLGRYADGYFDRRKAGPDPTKTRPNSTVSGSTRELAYTGGVFYNPENYASIFFPKVAKRGEYFGNTLTDTQLHAAGTSDQYYWSSSNCTLGGWALAGYPHRGSALAIRCVKD